MMTTATYGIGKLVQRPFDETVTRTREALKEQGFGVMCEIDVQATMKERLGVEGDKYVILGACNPPLAHRALTAEREIGLLLPCNVIVYETADGTRVSAIDAELMLGLVGNPELTDVAAEVRERLDSVIDSV
ncbi:MAG TPA: DUF302 domain-containing protein [Thermoleophilia bacterium]|nr:DUF302 domain-containing protein [Thermoleophilia bacterium]